MVKAPHHGVVVISEERGMSLRELCQCCELTAEQLLDMVSEGMLEPQGSDPQRWQFTATDLARIRAALRLQRDLGLNLAGAALAMELLDELRGLRSRVRVLEQLLR